MSDKRELYLGTNSGALLHLEPFGGLLRMPTDGAPPNNIAEVNKLASVILALCNGKNTVEEIFTKINDKFYSDKFDVIEVAKNFIVDSLSKEMLKLYDNPIDQEVKISGSYNYYSPIHFLVELTDACNLKCRHCYRESSYHESSSQNIKRLPTEQLLDILQDMSENGVITVELTGGEPTFHPDFKEIFRFCCENFNLVSIITNGWFIDEDVGREINRFKQNTIVQIDLDGDSAEMHDDLRGVKGSFEHALNAIRTLAKYDIRFRVAMNVYPKNYSSIENTLKLAKIMGATWFSFSPLLDIGRGKNMKTLSLEQAKNLGLLVKKFSEEYPNFFYAHEDRVRMIYETPRSCGAGFRSMVLGPSGGVRPCLMMDEKYFLFGNLTKISYKDFIKEASASTSFFHKLKSPNLDDCNRCRFYQFCVGCFVRPIYAMERAIEKNMPQTCFWNKKTMFFSMLNNDFQSR